MVWLWSANITSYGEKAQAFLGTRLVAEMPSAKAILMCLQEVHRDRAYCDKEAGELLRHGWRTTWNTGRPREDSAGCSPGSMIAATKVHVDFSAESLRGVIGDALGATRWECEDCSFVIAHFSSFYLLIINVYLTDTIRCTGANIDKLAAIKTLVMLLNVPLFYHGG